MPRQSQAKTLSSGPTDGVKKFENQWESFPIPSISGITSLRSNPMKFCFLSNMTIMAEPEPVLILPLSIQNTRMLIQERVLRFGPFCYGPTVNRYWLNECLVLSQSFRNADCQYINTTCKILSNDKFHVNIICDSCTTNFIERPNK